MKSIDKMEALINKQVGWDVIMRVNHDYLVAERHFSDAHYPLMRFIYNRTSWCSITVVHDTGSTFLFRDLYSPGIIVYPELISNKMIINILELL